MGDAGAYFTMLINGILFGWTIDILRTMKG